MSPFFPRAPVRVSLPSGPPRASSFTRRLLLNLSEQFRPRARTPSMFYCAYRKYPGELDVGEEHPLSLGLSHVLCIKVSCIRRNDRVMMVLCNGGSQQRIPSGYFTQEYPRYRATMVLRWLVRNSRIVRQIPTGGRKNVGEMLHGFYDAPDISLTKIEVSLSPRGRFDNKVEMRSSR